MSVAIREYHPIESLRPFVELYWDGSFNRNASGLLSLQMIPNGCVELIVHLDDLHCNLHNTYGWSSPPDYLILGMHTTPYEVRFKGLVNVFGIRFKPEGLYNIFGVPASDSKRVLKI